MRCFFSLEHARTSVNEETKRESVEKMGYLDLVTALINVFEYQLMQAKGPNYWEWREWNTVNFRAILLLSKIKSAQVFVLFLAIQWAFAEIYSYLNHVIGFPNLFDFDN